MYGARIDRLPKDNGTYVTVRTKNGYTAFINKVKPYTDYHFHINRKWGDRDSAHTRAIAFMLAHGGDLLPWQKVAVRIYHDQPVKK